MFISKKKKNNLKCKPLQKKILKRINSIKLPPIQQKSKNQHKVKQTKSIEKLIKSESLLHFTEQIPFEFLTQNE